MVLVVLQHGWHKQDPFSPFKQVECASTSARAALKVYPLPLMLAIKTKNWERKQREDKKRQRMYASTFYFHYREVVGQSTHCGALIPIGRFEKRIFQTIAEGR